MLTSIKKEGLQNVDDVRLEVENLVREQKKSLKLLEEFSSYSTLDEISINYGYNIKTVEGINFSSSQVPTLGNQPAFVGAAFAIEEGQTTKAFLSNKDIFIVKVDKVIQGPETPDFSISKNSLTNNLRGRASYQVYQSLVDLFDVKDNRIKFY